MKVEVPINMKFVEGSSVFGGQKAYTRQEAMDDFRRSADVATEPFIYLSAGVSNAEFTETLELAAEAGTRFSGVLCGRATWKDGIPIYGKQGADAFRKWLEDEGVKNIGNVNARLKPAHPWFDVLRRASSGRRAALALSSSSAIHLDAADRPRHVSPPYGTRIESHGELRGSGQRDRAGRQAGTAAVPCALQRRWSTGRASRWRCR